MGMPPRSTFTPGCCGPLGLPLASPGNHAGGTAMPRYTGGCLCGEVRIEIAAAPYRVGICHCLDCRKRQGAVFHTFAVFPVDAVTVTGETGEFDNRHFCPICGSPLFDRSDDHFELSAGC